jgi:SAM-dependent methyltransferase
MSSYIGRHAELYDVFYADKPYEDEAMFVHGLIQQHGLHDGKNILELACGTGSHAFVLERLGYGIQAIDYSADMITVAQQKARQRQSQVDFRVADMTALEDPQEPFDAVICLFDAIGYVQTNERIACVIEGARRQLRDNGLFIFEFWHAAAMLRAYDPVRIRHWRAGDKDLMRTSQTKLDCAKQLSHVTYDIYEFGSDGACRKINETQTNRYFLVQEMAHWLTCGGFAPLKWFAGFKPDEAINEDTWHIVAVARRSESGNVSRG